MEWIAHRAFSFSPHLAIFCHSEQSEESKVLADIAVLRKRFRPKDFRFFENDICREKALGLLTVVPY